MKKEKENNFTQYFIFQFNFNISTKKKIRKAFLRIFEP